MKSHAISRPGKTLSSAAAAELGRHGRVKAHAAAEPFVADYLPALLAQVHAMISVEFHAVASLYGCDPSEWRVLATLAHGEPVSIGRLAETVVMKQPTLTRVLDRMVATGQVRRVRHVEDRRIVLVNITPAGQKLADKLVPLAQAHEARILTPFGARGGKALKATLQRLISLHGAGAGVSAQT